MSMSRILAALLLSASPVFGAELYPWRFQGDIPLGEKDPTVTVFMGPVEVDHITGIPTLRQDTREPVTMKLSDLMSAMSLADPVAMNKALAAQKAAPSPVVTPSP